MTWALFDHQGINDHCRTRRHGLGQLLSFVGSHLSSCTKTNSPSNEGSHACLIDTIAVDLMTTVCHVVVVSRGSSRDQDAYAQTNATH